MKLSTYVLTQVVAGQMAHADSFAINADMGNCVEIMRSILDVCGESTGETLVTGYINVGLVNPRKEHENE